jgi:metallo-beta-lactamase family protein
MRLRFVGAATTVTGSQFLLTTERARVLIDCGMFQGLPSDIERNRAALPYDPVSLDAVLITHAHLDHCGYLPVVVREGFEGPVHLTSATADLALLILTDSAKIQSERARRRARRRRHPPRDADVRRADKDEGSWDEEARLRTQPPAARLRDDEPLYDLDDVLETSRHFESLRYREPKSVAPGITATFEDAGHILGSAIVVLDIEEAGRSRRIVFSGDLGRPDRPIIEDPTPITAGADFVVTESTYGGRHHAPEEEAIEQLAAAVRETADRHGVLLIPSFAVGRTQEIVWHLDRLLSAGEIPHLPLYLDSPMASLASDIYRDHPGYYDEETRDLLACGETPLDYPGAIVADTVRRSRAIATAPRPMIIVASSGMLTGGRVLNHLDGLIDDPTMTLLFVGYQGAGTLGAHIQGGARAVTLDGVERAVRCQVRSIDGFSAHADETELLDWLGHFARAERRPARVFLVHGDPEAAAALEPKVRALGLEPYRPAWREEVDLDRIADGADGGSAARDPRTDEQERR